MDSPYLIISTPLTKPFDYFYHEDYNAVQSILTTSASGVLIADYMKVELYRLNVPDSKMLFTDNQKTIPPKTVECPDNLGVIVYATGQNQFRYELSTYCNTGIMVIPSIGTVEHAHFFNELKGELKFPFVDIGPIGAYSRNGACGEPMGIEGIRNILDILDNDGSSVPYGVSGGIKLKRFLREGTYGFQDICSAFPERKPEAWIYGSDISLADKKDMPFLVDECLGLMAQELGWKHKKIRS
ncbi:MAG: hypothetical protein NDI94_01190 [Candidatus Woesearchaeota archaeon]|nr:hypothetical protein [Candidatus Woesearchaeota archaeon]